MEKDIQNQKNLIINPYTATLLISKFGTGRLKAANVEVFVGKLLDLLFKNEIDLRHYVFKDILELECDELRIFLADNGIHLQKRAIQGPPSESSIMETAWAKMNVANAQSMLIKALDHPEIVNGYNAEMEAVFPSFFTEIDQHFQKIEERLFNEEAVKVIPPPKNSFGIIFMCDVAHKNAFKNVKHEYRATSPLKLGVEITKIATEAANIPAVQAYLHQHAISNVEVLSLERIKERYLS